MRWSWRGSGRRCGSQSPDAAVVSAEGGPGLRRRESFHKPRGVLESLGVGVLISLDDIPNIMTG